ncbi:MAG: DNA mismatch repair endonuclease MutL, partial [Clostridia bacterium]|nr:DNA mismatch repair endonuclease MutL [Clostridia bacterium]
EMTKINLLDESVYNLISAGEVVENPASVVKELVENAIDAGADSISVSIREGGIKSITVTDNGVGMEEEDLRKCVLPHATSKISSASDLNYIGTLGFRGEALASIAAVSITTIHSKYFESDVGHSIVVKGGVVERVGTSSISYGTGITVENLFFNTPARFAFLKTPKGEENAVTATMIDLIFSNPDISFSYDADGAMLYKTNGSGLFDTIYPIYGAEVAANMIGFSAEEKGYSLTGYTARPATEAIRNNRSRQIFIVNGRVIEDQTLSAVVQNAYGEFLMKRTFPSIILDMVIPFDLVDVNVHPNKKEVRFADRKVINGLVYNAVKSAVEADAEARQKELFSVFHSDPAKDSESAPIKDNDHIDVSTPAYEKKTFSSFDFFMPTDPRKDRTIDRVKTDDIASSSSTEEEDSFSYLRERLNGRQQEDIPAMVLSDSHIQAKQSPAYRVIGQLFDTYLLLEIGDEVVFLDQHATHERILYDKLIEESKKNVTVQDLLLPYEYVVTPAERSFFLTNEDHFNRLGFRVEIGADKISVMSVPCILTNLDIGSFLQELIEYNKSFSELTNSSVIKDKIAKIACKRAIKGGDKLTEAQIEYVIGYFFRNGVPLQCPHGRPTMIKLSKTDIEKRFGRIV